MSVRAGSAILWTRQGHPKLHLFAVLTAPDGDPAKVLTVMLRSAKPFLDQTLILQPGDHPFLKGPTTVDYGSAFPWAIDELDDWVTRNPDKLRAEFSPQVLQLLLRGLCTSNRTAVWIKGRYCPPSTPIGQPPGSVP